MTAQTPYSLAAWRDALPPCLAELLLYAGSGKNHCLRLGMLALEVMTTRGTILAPALPPPLPPALALDFVLAAWEADPQDARLAQQFLELSTRLTPLSPLPSHKTALLRQSAAAASGNGTLHHWSEGDRAFREEDWQSALQHYQRVGGGWLTPLERTGHCLLRLGQHEEALSLWRHVLALRPWRTELILNLHDYLEGWDAPLSGPPGPTAALLYTWNKADDLHHTLHSLEHSLDDLALVVCLDNGSSDATPSVLHAFQDRWGERLHVHTLPVNVGAAAARNWLAALPEVRPLPFAAYIDDDVDLPSDWLRHLARAVRLFPQASAWGCRVVNADDPAFQQSGPLHLWPNFRWAEDAEQEHVPAQPDHPTPDTLVDVAFSPLLAMGEPFKITDFLCTGPDYGAYSFIRPCASVTGCCHLFRTETLLDAPFSLAFSPSQLDDLERDLRALHLGKTTCYTGFCAVRHKKRSGQGALSGAAFGNTLGNNYKLHGLWNAEEVATMVRHEHAVLKADLTIRLERLEADEGLC